MTEQDQASELTATINDVINRWSPPTNEPFEVRMMRVLLNLSAFEKDLALQRRGERPIRTDYPVPLTPSTPQGNDNFVVSFLLDGNFSGRINVKANNQEDAVKLALREVVSQWKCDTPDGTTKIEITRVVKA